MDHEAKDQALAVRGAGDLAPMGARPSAMMTAFNGLLPTSIGEAMTLAVALSKSTAIPKAYRQKPDTILTVILAGLEVGLTPIRSLNNLTNISGNLGMKADLQLALVRRSGLLDYFDEGFELRGKTDTDLDSRAEDGVKILALVKTVPDGKPYGWTTARRKGDANLTTRTFTWSDAETAEIWENDEDGGDRKKSKLSQKFNYQAFPADMYPKRARGRVLQITHSDVLAGMLSTEALEGGQVPVIDVIPEPADTLEDMLAEAADADAGAIVAGFDALEFSQARRLQKMIEYRGRTADLLTWLRDEYGQRSGKGKAGTARKAKAGAAVIDPSAQTSPAVPGPTNAGPAPTPQPTAPAAQPANAGPAPVAETASAQPAADSTAQAESLVSVLDSKFAAPAEPAAPTISPAKAAAAAFRERFQSGASF